MLRELKNLENPGGKRDILYFIQDVIGKRPRKIEDVYTLCAHAPIGYMLPCSALISYSENFEWIWADSEIVGLEETLVDFLNDQERLNHELINRTIKILFEEKIFTAEMFSYDVLNAKVEFHNEHLPLAYSTIRNTLIKQGLFIIEYEGHDRRFYINPAFEAPISTFIKKTRNIRTLEQLKEKLKKDEIIGDAAEKYVLSYEKRRVTNPILKEKIRVISELDVTAGYDLLSFESDQSHTYDRFIEVKAISNTGFYWSANEFNVAKIKGTRYYLYLVDLSQIKDINYIPLIICNPAKEIIESQDWIIETDSYHIRCIE